MAKTAEEQFDAIFGAPRSPPSPPPAKISMSKFSKPKSDPLNDAVDKKVLYGRPGAKFSSKIDLR